MKENCGRGFAVQRESVGGGGYTNGPAGRPYLSVREPARATYVARKFPFFSGKMG